MFSIIYNNERLIMEIRKIIKAFPHAVLIESENDCFTNNEFDTSIKNFQRQVMNLDSIKVKIENHQESKSHKIKGTNSKKIKNLRQLLQNQIEKLQFDEVVEKHSVIFKSEKPHIEKMSNLNNVRVDSDENNNPDYDSNDYESSSESEIVPDDDSVISRY